MKVLLERSVRVLPVLLFIAMLAFVACSDDDSEVVSPSPTAAGFDVTVVGSDGDELTLDARPERIVALAPSFTEIFCAVGACGALVAVDGNSDFPAGSPTMRCAEVGAAWAVILSQR